MAVIGTRILVNYIDGTIFRQYLSRDRNTLDQITQRMVLNYSIGGTDPDNSIWIAIDIVNMIGFSTEYRERSKTYFGPV